MATMKTQIAPAKTTRIEEALRQIAATFNLI